MIDKAPDAYRTISEVGEELDLPQHVLRFWETRFSQIRPLKRGGGRRYYRPDDVELLKGIRYLLYSEGYTIKGVQRILKEQGPKAVQAFAEGLAPSLGHPAPAGHDHYRESAEELEEEPQEADDAEDYALSAPPPRQQPVAAAPVSPAPQHVYPAPSAPNYPGAARINPAQPVPDLFEPPPPPVAPAPSVGPTVSFTRGGLLKPQPVPQRLPPMYEATAEPAPAMPIRKRLPPTVAEVAPAPFTPEPVYAETPAYSEGLGEQNRRALQAALVELSECRRAIDRLIAGRDRSASL